MIPPYPATPGWDVRCGCGCLGPGFGCAPPLLAGVLGCACLCVCSLCTPPLLAGVCGVGVGVWAQASAAPRHSWLGCWGVPVCLRAPLVSRHSRLRCVVRLWVFGLRFRQRPATPGWDFGVCVWWCGRCPCTPPLLAGVCGAGVGVWARVSAAPRHSWLGCAVWVCVFGFRFRLHPASPAWGVGVCVFSYARPACTPPLLAWVCGVSVGVWAPVSAAPRHSWLRCWGVHVCVRAPLVPRHSWLGCAVRLWMFGLGFRLRPATPSWGFGVCVWWCGRCPCIPPLLAGVCGAGVGVWARDSAAPRHSWLGCAVWVCVFGFFWPGCAPPLLAGVLGCVCARVRAPLVPRHSWPGCAVRVWVLGLWFRLRPATPGWVVRVCVWWSGRCLCTPPLLAGVCGADVGVWARVLAAPCHSWLGCAVWVCVFGFRFWLRLASPGLGVAVYVCSCARSACTPPLLAGMCGVRVCVWVPVWAAPRHSWPGCWGVCVLVWALPLYPASPGWGLRCGCGCLGLGVGCAPPLLASVLGCACWYACSPSTPPLLAGGCAVWMCLLGPGFRLRPATPGRDVWGVYALVCALRLSPTTPGWGVRCRCVCSGLSLGCAPPLLPGSLGCACWCACSPCTPPLLAGVCGVGVCVWAWVSAAPRRSWLGCWGVRVSVRALPVPRHSWLGCAVWGCVFGLGIRLRPATPGWGVQVCVLVFVLILYPATPGWGVRRGCVCFGSGFWCAPPLLAAVLGCVCAGVRAPPVPRHSWLGCAVSVCVFGLGFRLRPAALGWGVGV